MLGGPGPGNQDHQHLASPLPEGEGALVREVLKMASNVQTSKCWLQCTGRGTCDKETERDTQGDVANQLRSILLSARNLDYILSLFISRTLY